MSSEIWKFASRRLRLGEQVVLLVVAESSGSSPGRAGFKMLVTENEISGSIGGGVMEVALVERARKQLSEFKMQIAKCKMPMSSHQREIENRRSEIASDQSQIENRKSQIVEMVHRKNAANSSGMICSGKQTVIMYLLDADDVAVVEALAGSLASPVGLRIANDRLEVTDKTTSGQPRFERSGDDFVYEETLGVKLRLYIVGGGHCALALSEIAPKLGFAISLFDDREGLNTIEKNSFADEKTIIGSYQDVGELIPDDEGAFVVVMTLGFKFDEIVVRALFKKRFRYFGVLGSKAKIQTMFAALEKDGFERARLDKIHAPIGIPINSRTPEEIAVSIAAELIAVKNAV